ncbi:MAG: hypothetical protein HYU70_00840 [Bacteroidetes bacterium]|nr:hypothetical protein [Bacteroidota bacterium]
MKFLLFLCFITSLSFMTAEAQQPKVVLEDYLGTWRWISGKRDTLIIRLVPAIEKSTPLRPVFAQVFGFHSYISAGKLVESNLHLKNDTLSNIASIGGGLVNNVMNISFHDLTYNDFLMGTFRLLQDYPKKAILELSMRGERSIDRRPEPYPNARTVPNNIVLEKIE